MKHFIFAVLALRGLRVALCAATLPWEVEESSQPPTPVPTKTQPKAAETPSNPPQTESADIQQMRSKAEAGDVDAALALGHAYREGKGVAAHPESAVVWYRAAAMAGNAAAMNFLGIQLWKGQGIAQNKEQALLWFRRAAEQGDIGGAFNAGIALSKGPEATRNKEEALRFFRQAEKGGYAKARAEIDKLEPPPASPKPTPKPPANPTSTPLPDNADAADRSLDKVNRKLDKLNSWLDAFDAEP